MSEPISSPKNALIKKCIALEKKRHRNDLGLFVIEGIRETSLALQNGWEIEVILFPVGKTNESDLTHDPDYPLQFSNFQAVEDHIFDKIAYRKGLANVVSIAKQRKMDLNSIPVEERPLILALQKLEKPGNIGAILRTADAAGIQTVVLVDPLADKYNPNLIRSSLGASFCLQVIEASSEELFTFCKKREIPMLATYLEGATAHYDTNFSEGAAIIMGSEAFGIDEFWIENSDAFIKIPMYGHVDSMNVSTSCAVVVFEAVRQLTTSKQ